MGNLKGENNLKYKDKVKANIKQEIKTFAARKRCVDCLTAWAS